MQVEIVNDKLLFEPENFTEHYAITEYIRQHTGVTHPPLFEISDEVLIKE